MRVGLVLGAGGVLGGAWLVGDLHAVATESGWDPGSAEYLERTSAGAMIAWLAASGEPPWFMAARAAEADNPCVAGDGWPPHPNLWTVACDDERDAG